MTGPEALGLLLTEVDLGGTLVDVRTRGPRITEVAPGLRPAGELVIAGRGGALLPGLHDHHLHLHALAAARHSLDVGPDRVSGLPDLARALQTAPQGDGWLRAVGYHESVAGELDRHVLDRLLPDRPLRVQHRSGALWMLNSKALDLVAGTLDPGSPDIERDAQERPNGRLWRYDRRLREHLAGVDDSHRVALREVRDQLLGSGITGVTDATPDLDEAGVRELALVAPLHVQTLGVGDTLDLPANVSRGPRKLLLRDHDLPDYDTLRALIDQVGADGRRRAVAVHCVSRESLILTVAVLADLGACPGDRIEHGAIIPPELDDDLRRLGLTVVTQPDFLRSRGDTYLAEVDVDDLPHLYRWASLCRVGIRVAGSSDAPFGDPDPWQVIRSARDRTTRSGAAIGAGERIDSALALDTLLTPLENPGGAPRRVAPGAPASLCLLSVSYREQLAAPCSEAVRMTVIDGRPAWSR
ncbi:amidohydrolase family protein [Streptomyces sp. TE5632]